MDRFWESELNLVLVVGDRTKFRSRVRRRRSSWSICKRLGQAVAAVGALLNLVWRGAVPVLGAKKYRIRNAILNYCTYEQRKLNFNRYDVGYSTLFK